MPAQTQAHTLNTEPNFARPDDFYEALIESHQGLSAEESHAFNARLVLLLAAMHAAREDLGGTTAS